MVIQVNEQTIRRGKVRLVLPEKDAAWEAYRFRLMAQEPAVFEYPRKDGAA